MSRREATNFDALILVLLVALCGVSFIVGYFACWIQHQ